MRPILSLCATAPGGIAAASHYSGQLLGNLDLNFADCAPNSRFTVTLAVTANGGAYNTQIVIPSISVKEVNGG